MSPICNPTDSIWKHAPLAAANGLWIFLAGFASADVVINEIHYEPLEKTPLEFIELHNSGDTEAGVGGWKLEDGVVYLIPDGTSIAAGGYLVIAQDPGALKAAYAADALGPWEGQTQVDDQGNVTRTNAGRLDNDGERITLLDASGARIDRVDYRVQFPWPLGSAGDGGSMELIHPGLDNDLGSSWRTSKAPGVLPEATLLGEKSPSWRVRTGESEASQPVDAWRAPDFVEDASWAASPSPIGFGGVGDVEWGTEIAGMQSNFSGVFARNSFNVAPGEIPSRLLIRFFADDGIVIWINGEEVVRERVEDGDVLFTTEASSSQSSEGTWEEVELSGVGGYVGEGENVIAVQAFNSSIGGSDFGFDVQVIRPAPEEAPLPEPTPGRVNSTFVSNAPPNLRQVDHSPRMPNDSEETVVSIKVTDPDGVATVKLLYQVVKPGEYIPARLPLPSRDLNRVRDPDILRELNPAFEDPANWQSVAMVDDGSGGDEATNDDTYTVTLPAFPNRHLIRYRIEAVDNKGSSVRAPFADDTALNFAYYVYNGVPDYVASEDSVVSDGYVHRADVLTSLPVYSLITRNADIRQCYAYSGSDQIQGNSNKGRRIYNWDGTIVYDGVVYDHIGYRLRGANGRHQGAGKRSMKIKFNRGRHLEADNYEGERMPTKWRVLNVGKMFSNRGVGNMGMVETINNELWRMVGVPAPYTFWFHMRVVDGMEEAPDQYAGDFWGMFLGFERYDVRFLEAHGMEKGNIYKLSDQVNDWEDLQRYQAPDAVNDGTDWRGTKRNFTRSKSEEWIMAHANMEKWYAWAAVKEAVQHYDWPSPSDKNMCWYFEPPYLEENDGYGKLWLLPYDHDDTWGPVWNGGIETIESAIENSDTVIRVGEKNVKREFRELIWQPDQLDTLIDSLAGYISDFHKADRDRWRRAPASEGREDWNTLERKVADMKKFAWEGGSWPGGTVRAGGRAAHLDNEARDSDIPERPEISYAGANGYPFDGLTFNSTPFADPDGKETFGAMEWRLAEITPVGGGEETFLTEGSTWKYLDTGADLGTSWRAPGFDDGGWASGPAQFGYGDNDEATTINFGPDSSAKFITTYFRTEFSIEDPETYETLILGLLRDDGAVVYLNGEEIVRDNMPAGEINFETLSDGKTSSEDKFFEHEVPVSEGILVAGRNVLAVELHQSSGGDSDTSFDLWMRAEKRRIPAGTTRIKYEWFADWESGELPEFSAAVTVPADVARPGLTYRARVRHQDDTGRWSSWSPALEFVASGPDLAPWMDGLVITEIMYNPADATEIEAGQGWAGADFEYVEIFNRGDVSLDLANVRFTKGVNFDFSDGSLATIAPGQVALVVGNEPAFRSRYGSNLPVIGSWGDDRLANGGERLKLSFGAGVALRDFEYNDKSPWPESADGGGFSIELINPSSNPDHSVGSNWRASATINGSPGVVIDGGGARPPLEVPVTAGFQTIEVNGATADYLTISFRQAAGQALAAESSSDLVNWTVLATDPVAETDHGDGSKTLTLRASEPIGSVPALYLRLRGQ